MTGQTTFVQALLDPDMPEPAGLMGPDGGPAGRRFSVYRNNVAVSLTEALHSAFPVIAKLVGDEFFDAMAGVYLRAHPPKSPVLWQYGADMPGFVADFEPTAHLGYLPDIARLELALRQSYHGADAPGVDPALMQSIPAEQLMRSQIYFAPAVRLVRSDWPIHAIWMANMGDGPSPQMAAEDVLVCRPGFDPAPHLLGKGAADFIQSLAKGNSLETAIDHAGEGFDLASTLGVLLANGAITKIIEGTENNGNFDTP